MAAPGIGCKTFVTTNLFMEKFRTPLRIIIGASALGLVCFSFAAPIVQNLWGYPSGEIIYHKMACICHQYPTRCIWVGGRPTALCARCTAAYFGVFVAAMAARHNCRWQKRFFIGAVLLAVAVLDPVRQLLTNEESTLVARITLGFVGGIGVFLFMFPFLGVTNKLEDQ